MLKAIQYINQFFGQVGGEDMADYEPEIREGAVGCAQIFNSLAKDVQVTHTIICGDNFMASRTEEAVARIMKFLEGKEFGIFVAGPAFNAGRYGTACGGVSDAVTKRLGIPVVTGMYQENPGVDMYRKTVYIVKTDDSARGIKSAVPAMAKLLLKALKNGRLGSPEEDGYMERGVRVNVFHDRPGADRAVEMLVRKLNGQEFKTEYPMPIFDRVAPAEPIKDMKNATIALVTSGGIVPKGNPDHIEASSATKYGTYSIAGVMSADGDSYATAHGGYDPTYANIDPNRVIPIDELREMEQAGEFKKLYDYFFTTVGNGTPVANSKKFGAEIGERLKKDGVDAVILTST